MTFPLQLSYHREEWPLAQPFRVTGLSIDAIGLVLVELSDGTHIGRGEALPWSLLKDSPASLSEQLESLRLPLAHGLDRETLRGMLPPGGARKALDSALWDLEAKRSGKRAWELTGIAEGPVTTAFTIGIEETPAAMADKARHAAAYSLLKIKLDAIDPIERVAAIRTARPDARLIVDANQGWSFTQLKTVAPALADLGVEMIEQPLPRGDDAELEDWRSPIALCADESCRCLSELDPIAARYAMLNIKLDKAGGLTEALALARAARAAGLKLMVGTMGGTSLSIAPAMLLAQLCDFADLDAALLLRHDRFPSIVVRGGQLEPFDANIWG